MRGPSKLSVYLLASTALSGVSHASAQSLPTGYSTAYGSVGFQRSSGSLTINQSSQNAIVNYNSFSVGHGNSVTFNQPNSSSAILNRVTGTTPSTIAGQISANGQVYLVNPNGIAITKTGVVKIGGGFTASSLGMTDDEFRHARKHFKGGGSSAMVSNAGTISIGRGGYAALIGGQVRNSGLIAVPMGKVGLGSGEAVTLDVSGDGFLQVAVPTSAGGKGVLIQQSGTISSAGGTVILDAATARAAARNAVNISGTIDAHSISGHSGSIQIGGGDGGEVGVTGTLTVSGGRHFAGGSVTIAGRSVKVSGTIKASGRVGGKVTLAAADGTTITGLIKAIGHHGKGGTVTATGLDIVLQGAKIDASGTSGGGTVLIGGNAHGAGPLPNAGTVTIDAKSTITADAIGTGDGGQVVVWSDEITRFAGLISAKGGQQGGDGGHIEVSGHQLAFDGHANTTAPHGQTGVLLLDPYTLTIDDTGSAPITPTGTNPVTYSSGAHSDVTAASIDAQLAGTNVVIQAGPGADGSITVSSNNLDWTTTNTLTLNATGNININGSVYGTSGTLHLISTAGNITQTAPINVGVLTGSSGGNTTLTNSGNVVGTLGAFSTGGSFTLADSAGLTVSGAIVSNTDGTAGTSLALSTPGAITLANGGSFNTVGGLLSLTTGGNITIASSGTATGADMIYSPSFVQGQLATGGLTLATTGGNVTVAAPLTWSTSPTLTLATSSASGAVTVAAPLSLSFGAGLSLASAGALTIDAPVTVAGAGAVALAYNNATATNLSFGLTGSGFTGSLSYSGGTTGQALTINGQAYTLLYSLANANATGPDAGASDIAGIDNNTAAGEDSGFYALATSVSGTGTTFTSALVGAGGTAFSGTFNGLGNTISNLAISTGANNAGPFGQLGTGGVIANVGVVGETVAQTNGANYAGGLVGEQAGGAITSSYATGVVSEGQFNGGLVGFVQSGTITSSYATGAVSGDSSYNGGLVGVATGGTITSSYATGAVSGENGSASGGLVGYVQGGTITSSYATGAVSGDNNYNGGLVGYVFNGTITSSYATGAVSGGSDSANGGLAGYRYGGTIMSSYWDILTTGQSASAGGTGLTTAQLQGTAALPDAGTITDANHLGSAFAGGANGLYPYLTSFFPNGVQAVSGFAYTDAGVTPLSGTVSVVANGTAFGTASAGANGYYYLFGAPSTSLAASNSLLAYSSLDGVAQITSTGAVAQIGPTLYGNAITVATTATMLSSSAFPTLAAAKAAITGAGTDAGALAAIAAAGGLDVVTSGASFTIDAPVTTANTFVVQTTASNAPITVNAGDTIAISPGGSLGLLASGALAIDAPITVNGAGTVALAAANDTTTVPGTSLLELSFGNGASLSYTGATTGQALAINGQGYTLIYNQIELNGIDPSGNGTGATAYGTGLSSHYALAGDLALTGTYSNAVIGESIAYTGTFNGLGNTISNLVISTGATYAGLFGQLGSGGTIENVGLVGGSVTGTNSSLSDVGGLVGFQNGGTILSSYATGAVSGGYANGGLVGMQGGDGTITSSYATGAVAGGSYAGGLVGVSSGTITQAYATGVISGENVNGGLVGFQDGGTITSSYATGAVAGGSYNGGLVGFQIDGTITQAYATGSVSGENVNGGLVGIQSFGDAITSSYWDTQTTGQSISAGGGTGLTTAQLQGAAALPDVGTITDANHLGSAFSGGANGLDPYLTSAFPNGVQAVSGIAYTDAGATPLASGAAGTVSVAVIGNGVSLGAATTGANGYYYVFGPAGSLTSGNNVLAYTSANAGTGSTNAATLTIATSAANQQNVNVYGNAVTMPATATSLSALGGLTQAQSAAQTSALAVDGGNAVAAAAINGASGLGLSTAGAFTIDQPVTTASTFVVQTASGSALTVADAITISPGGSLGLLSAGTLAINANITVQGAGAVALTTPITSVSILDGNGTISLLNLSFAQGASLSFTGTNATTGAPLGSLTINGQGYTLLNALATANSIGPDMGTNDVAGIDANSAAGGDGGHYALATNLDGTGTTFGAPLVNGALSGTFEGLGHTITNLTISDASDLNVGFIGQNSGTVRDIGLVGGSVSAGSSSIFPTPAVGFLVGLNVGIVANAYETGAVDGGGNYTNGYSSNAGGLVGRNGYSPNYYTFYAGTIIDSYATGAVSNGYSAGGLVGYNDYNGTVTQSYATGAVSTPSGGGAGGLIGENIGQFGNSIAQVYATGAVSGYPPTGGLIGYNAGVVQNAYWDTLTTGQSNGFGPYGQQFGSSTLTGYTTAQLQGTAPISGSVAQGNAVYFSTATGLGPAFAGGANGVYPYLKSFFPNGVQTVSGLAYSDTGATPLTSSTVSVIANNQSFGLVTTGANGYYYAFGPAGSLASGNSVLAATSVNTGATDAATLAFATGATNQQNVNIFDNTVTVPTTTTSLATYLAANGGTLAAAQTAAQTAAEGADDADHDAAASISGATGLGLVASGPRFAVDTPVTTSGTAFLVQTTAPGAPITVTAPITINDIIDSGGSLVSSGSLGLIAAGALSIDANVTVTGAGFAALAYDQNTTTPSVTDLAFAQGASLSFTGVDIYNTPLGTLAINGAPYTLLTSLIYDGHSDMLINVADIGRGALSEDGNYALAFNLDGTGHAFSGPLVGPDGQAFTGTFEGLGHTITNLTINSTGNQNIGLVGQNSGTVRDIGLVGGTVSGFSNVGSLVGANSGAIVNAYATGVVSGSSAVGGLVGYNSGGAITQAYATGFVDGGNYVGGLVGYVGGGLVSQAYATGAVSGTDYVGGLAGINLATVIQAYATGAVNNSSGSISQGGLVGLNGGTITQTYFDTQTTGESSGSLNNIGSGTATGLTTALVQSGGAGGLGSAFSGGANGAYPYLASFFPNGVQAVSGTAYTDAGATPLASAVNGAVPVTVVGANTVLGTATTGANGYYYVFGQPGTITQGASLVAYTTANMATGATNAAGIAASTYMAGTPAQTGVNIYEPVALLAASTNALTLSASGYNPATAPAVPTGSAVPSFLTGAIPALAATNAAGFTIDETLNLTTSFAVQTTASGAPLTVADAITVGNGSSLGLTAADALAIDANITVPGTGAVSLTTPMTSVSTLDGIATINLSFAQGASLSFTGTTGAPLGSLTINGTSYTLLNALAQNGSTGPDHGANDVAGIDNNTTAGGDGGHYALATNLDGTGTTFGAPLINGALSGTFEGLGHTISNLTISDGGDANVGFIGQNNGTVRDIGFVGGSVTSSSANFNGVGFLVGLNEGTVAQAYATGAVNAGGNIGGGGLVGINDTTGTITQAYATGVVTNAIYGGGLVGHNSGTISWAYASGGAVEGSVFVGGLVGYQDVTGTITQAYATGAVNAEGNYGGGGLVGFNYGTITQAYWDTLTSGLTYGFAQNDGSASLVTGYTTAQLQGTAPISGSGQSAVYFSTAAALGSAFSGGANGAYPYLASFFPNGVQAVSGIAYTNAGTKPLASPTSSNGLPVTQDPGLVFVATAGAGLDTVTTGANGYYYLALPANTLASGTTVVAYTQANPNTLATPNGSGAQNAATYFSASGATNQTGVAIYGGWQFDQAGATSATLSALNAADATAAGSLAPTGFANREIVTSAPSFALNAVTSLAGTLVLDATGNVTQSAALTATTLRLDGGGNFALTGSNAIATLAATGGTIDVDTAGAVAVGSASDATGTSEAGIDATGPVTLISGGAQTLAAHGTITSGGAILLAGKGIFTNAAGANALTPGNAASFTIYSQDPTHPTTMLPADVFGGLVATNYYNDAYNFSTQTFASAVPTGNHFVYGYAATLTPILSGSATKIYNGTTAASLTNLTIGATLLSGSDVATFSFTGANYATANAGSNKTVTATGITFDTNPDNYVLGSLSASAAVGTIGKATITVAGATGIDKTYDTTTALLNGAVGFTHTSGLGNDQVIVTAGTDAYASANAGAESIDVSGLTLSGAAAANYQLSATSVIGSGTIGKATITVAGVAGIDKIYDTTTALTTGASGFTDTGVLGNDQVTVTAGSDAYASANAGGEAINVSGLTLSGSAAGNYQLSATSVTGSGTIGKATITVAGATGIDKTYDTTTALTTGASGFTDTGVLVHDHVTVTAGSDVYAGANAGNESINVSGLTLSGAAAGNYQLSATSVTGSGTIGKATITVAGATGIDKTYDTTTALLNGAVGFTHTSGLGNDQVIVTAGTDAYASANAGAESIDVSGLTLSGAAAANYQLSSTSVIGSGTIGKATITVAGATGIDKTYDTTTALLNGAVGFTHTSGLGNDQVIVTAGTDAYASANAGAESIDVSGLTLSGSAAANYQLSATSVTGSGTIGKATITVAGATGIDKTYDTTTALANGAVGFTHTSGLGNDQVIVTAGTDAYASANAGAESIDVSGLTLSGAAAANYQLSSTSVIGSGTIGKATITVAGATGIDKTYDTTTALTNGASGFTDTGVLGNDQVIVTAGTDAYASANAGAESIAVSGLTLSGAAAGNYQLSATSVTGSGTIGKATITVAGATGIDKTYDTTTALTNGASGFTDTGVLGHDQVTVTAGSDAYASANAGNESINVSGLTLSGAAAGNYQLSSTSVTGSGTIGKATITVAGATGIDKTYDATTALTNGATGFTDTGVLGHDHVTVTAGSDAYASANAGAESIDVSGLTLSGAASSNYQLSSTAVTGSGTIGKATITVAGATGIDKTYDTTTALANGATGFTDTGVLGHDHVTVTAGSDAYASANAGAESIDVSGLTLSGAASSNYQLSSTAVTGSGTIGKATITVAGVTGIDKTYDTTTALTNGASGFTDTGVLGHDQVTVSAGNDAYASANAGAESIDVSGLTLSGAAAANYQLSSTSVIGSGTIGKATITVAGATGIDKTYDTTTALTNGTTGFTDTGVLGHDQVIITAGTDAYASANAGAESIDVSGLTLSGAAAGNYQLSSTSVTGSGTIGKATIIVTANGGHSIYGDTPTDPGLSVTGLQGGQGVDVLTGLSNSFGINGRTDAGAYILSVAGMLTNANYTIGSTRTGTFDVTPRALTITADDETRAQGFANPPLAYQIGGLGLVNGDHVAGALFTPATTASPIGRYAIEQGTLSVPPNYSVSYVPGTLTVGASVNQSAGTLGSTVDRALLQTFGRPRDSLPFIVSPDGEGTSASEIIRDLGDPRFDETIVCVKDVCTIVVTRKPIKTTSLEPRP